MRMERIWAQQEKDRQVAEALAKFAAMQTGLKNDKKMAGKGEVAPTERDRGQAEVPEAGVEQKAKTERKKTHAKVAVKKLHQKREAIKSTGTG